MTTPTPLHQQKGALFELSGSESYHRPYGMPRATNDTIEVRSTFDFFPF